MRQVSQRSFRTLSVGIFNVLVSQSHRSFLCSMGHAQKRLRLGRAYFVQLDFLCGLLVEYPVVGLYCEALHDR